MVNLRALVRDPNTGNTSEVSLTYDAATRRFCLCSEEHAALEALFVQPPRPLSEAVAGDPCTYAYPLLEGGALLERRAADGAWVIGGVVDAEPSGARLSGEQRGAALGGMGRNVLYLDDIHFLGSCDAGVFLATSATRARVSSWVALLKSSPVPAPAPGLVLTQPQPQPAAPLPIPAGHGALLPIPIPMPQQDEMELLPDLGAFGQLPAEMFDWLGMTQSPMQEDGLLQLSGPLGSWEPPASPAVPPAAGSARRSSQQQQQQPFVLPADQQPQRCEVTRLRGIIQRLEQRNQLLENVVLRLCERLQPHEQPQPLYPMLFGEDIPDDLRSLTEMDLSDM